MPILLRSELVHAPIFIQLQDTQRPKPCAFPYHHPTPLEWAHTVIPGGMAQALPGISALGKLSMWLWRLFQDAALSRLIPRTAPNAFLRPTA